MPLYPNAIAHARFDETIQEQTENPLAEHLHDVSRYAADFAENFSGEHWSRVIGLWHDLGKYNPEFQEYIHNVTNKDKENAHLEEETYKRKRGPDHSSAGALYALEWLKKYLSEKEARMMAPLLAYPIMGHHAGLADYDGGNGSLYTRLHAPREDHLALAKEGNPPPEVLSPNTPAIHEMLGCFKDGRDIGFFIRMLFSCLVDADFLDTEQFMSPGKAEARQHNVSMEMLQEALQVRLAELGKIASTVNTARAEVLEACLNKANRSPGFFSLVVPTGGGKTLSSLAFALSHAVQHNKQRVIYAIPYTSIIEQTAQVFRDTFSHYKDVVIEHHSNIADAGSRDETSRQRLASENWNAPLIVTTTVQLFESLFANRTSRCRKLHNIANSIIILDEAHLMPPELREPILFSLDQLVKHYGVTVVLCTATPTGIENLKQEKKYIPELCPIIQNVEDLYTRLKRVEVVKREGKVSDWSELAEELSQYEKVLCIVSRRDDCRELHAAMPEGTIHLSALMCAEHRSEIIKGIKQKLKDKELVRVISTQLVEAGVDVDFPVVYRAMAGLDSIAQAAGRCNREGKLDGLGKVVVFTPVREAPPGLLKHGSQIAAEILRFFPEGDLLSPSLQQEYFKRFYANIKGDKKDILKLNEGLKCQFREMADSFRMVEDNYKSVVVSYNNDSLLHQLMTGKPERWMLRKAQRFAVSIPQNMLQDLIKTGAVKEILPELYVQDISQVPDLYNESIGLALRYHKEYAAGDLVV